MVLPEHWLPILDPVFDHRDAYLGVEGNGLARRHEPEGQNYEGLMLHSETFTIAYGLALKFAVG